MATRFCILCRSSYVSISRSKVCGNCRVKSVRAGHLIHSCHSADLNEPLPPGCKCRKRVSDSELKSLIECGEVVPTEGGAHCYAGRRKMAPRTATLEKNHILGGVGITEGRRRRSPARDAREIERLKQIIEEDRAARAEEMRQRWEIYGELDRAMWSAITIEVPEIVDVWEGRCIFASAIGKDDRTTIGHTVDREYLPEVFDEPDLKDEIVERDEGVVGFEEAKDVEEIYEEVVG